MAGLISAGFQSRAAIWHCNRFPICTAEDVTLKAMTELGEVADAILAHGRDSSHPERASNIAAEAADVVITMLALVGRFTADDLIAAIDAKLAMLEQRGGAHPASLPNAPEGLPR
jgi:NTP pyrophosphatase (non-canonical NTP hydrolase)